MIACLDVDYRDDSATGTTTAAVACLLLDDWTSAAPAQEITCEVADVAAYEPGAFYKREMPCLLAALALVSEPLIAIVVDGYVWLGTDEDGAQKPGLGARLYTALDERLPVIGVAKTAFRGAGAVTTPVVRGSEAKNPLHVTAVGVDPLEAARRVASMHGPHRLPTALKRVDALCRAAYR